jgi:predicted nicotinamide N-methyase
MSEQQYDIIFRGDIVFGHQLSEVKLRLQQLFKADGAKIEMLFSGKPTPLKRNVDLASAQKYRDALIKAGAQVELVASADLKPVVTTVPAAKESFTSTAETQSDKNWSIAPTGADILQGAERKIFVAKNVDTSAISLRPEGGNLVDAEEQRAKVTGVVTVPNYAVAEVGADLIRDHEKQKPQLLDIELRDWDIAELGADMINENEKPVVTMPKIKQLNVSLAPVGADLEQIKPNVKPVSPDISKIRLAD